jgi:hypothetical protein
MKGIFVIRGSLTVFGSLRGDIDTIGSLGDIKNEVVVWRDYMYFSLIFICWVTFLHTLLCRSFYFIKVVKGQWFIIINYSEFQAKNISPGINIGRNLGPLNSLTYFLLEPKISFWFLFYNKKKKKKKKKKKLKIIYELSNTLFLLILY